MRHWFIVSVLLCTSIATAQQSPRGVVSGTVTEAGTGEAVIGANVLVLGAARTGRSLGAATNRYGYFALASLPMGAHRLRVTSVGFRADTVDVVLTPDKPEIRIEIHLESESIEMAEVTVEAVRTSDMHGRVSSVDVPVEQVLRLPALGGEADLFRALQLVPGVKAASELSSGLYIRGGSPDQNLVLLDRMPVYNPSHLAGFLSTFNTDAINHVTLIKGAMPAEYGGRLSSVIDITMKEGARDRLHGSGGVSMIDSRLTLEGPVTDDATFMVSGRRVYLDAMIALFSEEKLGYYFYDFVAKGNMRLGANDRLFASGIFGRDVFADEGMNERYEINWGNTALNLRWTHVHSSRLFTNASFIVSNYAFNSRIEEQQGNFKSTSGIFDYILRGEAEWYPATDHVVKGGIEAFAHGFAAEATARLDEFGEFPVRPSRTNVTEASLYAQDEWSVNERLRLNLGGRLLYFDHGGFMRAEPRLAAFYTLDDGTTLKAAFAGANQVLHLVTRADLGLPTDMWFPSSQSLPPAWSVQYVLGASRSFDGGAWDVSLETYYKTMRNLLEFKENAEFTVSAPLADELRSGSGRAWGAELFVQKRMGALTGWIGYTLAWAERTFPDLNRGRAFPPRYDRRHDVSVVANYRLGESWELTATWVYGTGQAFTYPVAQYAISEYNTPYYLYTDRNGGRLPASHRLDLNFSHAFSWFGWAWKAHISVYNAYNYRNPFSRRVDRVYNDDGTVSAKMVQMTLFPIIPSIGLTFAF